jgi:hypothetical protein
LAANSGEWSVAWILMSTLFSGASADTFAASSPAVRFSPSLSTTGCITAGEVAIEV